MRNVRCEYPSDLYRVAQPTTGIHHQGLNHTLEWSNQPDPYLPYTPVPQTNHPPRYSRSSPYPSLSLQPPQPHLHWQSLYPYFSGGNFGDSGLQVRGSRPWISTGCWASYGVSQTIQLGGGTGSGNVMSDDQGQGFGWPEGEATCEGTGDAGWGWQPLSESIDIVDS
ncbi:hypothetical protein C8F01DRAFT_1126558 [Mycena amicta]|nr:hypothetical protein C8F01DRAFT_1126558 [Mycena amicta]